MTHRMLSMYVRSTSALQRRVGDREAGQGTLEYVGMIIVAGLIAAAVVTAARGVDLAGFFTEAISSVTGG